MNCLSNTICTGLAKDEKNNTVHCHKWYEDEGLHVIIKLYKL